MSDIVIKAENLGKKYRIGHQAESGRYTALRDVLMENARGVWQKTRDLFTGRPTVQGDTHEDIWALKDVNFEIRQGEAVGIIGRNGAGKSTLLKILSRITEPTEGRVTIRGRVASLLEVGTGFHPELTGRENIYLNGAILGMSRAEIKRKFDEIVAFAEVEKFLDTPVKRYSSGMYVRLAFAVAAHLEPEILVVDEVLAVGDAAFQKKCIGKMEDVSKEGRTVLFVSHNMDAINTLCSRAFILLYGLVKYSGDAASCVNNYINDSSYSEKSIDLSIITPHQQRYGKRKRGQFLSLSTVDDQGNVTNSFEFGNKFEVRTTIKLNEKLHTPEVGVCITNRKGHRLSHLCTEWDHPLAPMEAGLYSLVVCINNLMLYPDEYLLCCWLRTHHLESSEDFIEAVLQFRVFQSKNYHMDFSQTTTGGVYIKTNWSCHREP